MSESYSKFKELSRDDGHWITIPADGKSIEDLHQEILERVVQYYTDEVDTKDLSLLENSLFQ